MALFLGTVMVWQGTKRVRDASNGTQYLLNTNRLDSIRAHGASESSLFYFDDPFNSRDKGAYMEVVKTPTELIAYIDTSQNKYVTLPVFPMNDSTETAVNHTFLAKDIAYAVAQYTDADYSLVTYCDSAFKKYTVLVDYTLAEIIALM